MPLELMISQAVSAIAAEGTNNMLGRTVTFSARSPLKFFIWNCAALNDTAESAVVTRLSNPLPVDAPEVVV